MQQKGKRTLWVVRDGSRESDTRPEARPGGSRLAGACGAVFWAGSQDPGSGVGVGAGEGEEGPGLLPPGGRKGSSSAHRRPSPPLPTAPPPGPAERPAVSSPV